MATTSPDTWNPEQYKKFQSERSRPFWDLAKKINFENVFSMLDIGCGTGELTKALHMAHQIPRTVGLDESARMLSESEAHSARGLSFERITLEKYKPQPNEKFDLVLSNAALQWVEKHEEVFPRILSWLNAGGTLAVQMPLNFEHPSHRIAELVAPNFGLRPRTTPVLAPESYARLLWDAGLTNIDVSVKVYLHPMPSALEVVEWTRGTLLTHYQKQLTTLRFAEFLKEYTEKLIADTGDGAYLYTFKRLFIVGVKD